MRRIAPWVGIFWLAAASASAQQTSVAKDKNELATLSGKTTGTGDQPLRKSTVTLRPMFVPTSSPADQPRPFAATTDAEGKFAFTEVEPGRYTLTAEHAGYLRTGYGAKNNLASPMILNLTAGKEMNEIVIRMTEQSVVTGKVVDDEEDPVARVRVQLMRQGFNNGRRQLMPAGAGQTDDNGEFKITGISPGRYFLSANPQQPGIFGDTSPRVAGKPGQPEEQLVSTYYPGVVELSAAAPIVVPAAQTLAGMNIRLRKSAVFHIRGKISGTVADPSRTRVMVMPRDGFSLNFNTGGAIRKDGSFDVAGVVSGSYNLAVVKLEGMAQTLGMRPVEIGKQDLEDVVVNAEVLADLRGSIRVEGPEKQAKPDANGSSTTSAANPKFRISVFPTDGIPFSTPDAAANDEGEFTLRGLGAGKYRVNVNGIPAGSYLKSIMFGGQDALDAGLDLSAGAGDSALQIVVSRTAGQVSGVVQGEDGKPAPGSMVTLVPDPPRPEQSNLYRTAPTDQSGQFNLDSLRPGKYRIYAWEELEQGLQFEPEILKAVESRGTAVTVAESATQQLTATQISSVSLEDAKRRAGR